MDQEKIGKFIAACRKAQDMTQAVLAEKLEITDRAVSKWENGHSLPDAAIMPQLCELLNISLTELFTGERVAMENYKETTDALLLEMKSQEETANKRLLNLEKFLIWITLAVTLTNDNHWGISGRRALCAGTVYVHIGDCHSIC